MLTQLKQFAPKAKLAIICYHIYDNWWTKRQFSSGKIELTSGSTHWDKTLKESLSYIDQVFEDYLFYSGISIDMLRGKRILEIGPGDNVGVALKFLLAGAKRVVCLDKFFSKYNWEQQRKIYQAMIEQLPDRGRQIFDEVIDLETGIMSNPQKLVCSYGMGIERAEEVFEPESFDLIVSRAVFEHLYNPDAAFSTMDKLLSPGGYMVHKIDFRDHGIFSKHHHHPLTFLTLPEAIYRRMVYDSGKPNRKLINYYRQKTAGSGYETKILITSIVGVESEVEPHQERVIFGTHYSQETLSLLKNIRPHLQNEFRDLPDEDLMVAGIYLVAKKL